MYSPREASKDHLYTHSFVSLLLILPLAVMMLMAKGDGIPHLKVALAPMEAPGVIDRVETIQTNQDARWVYYTFTLPSGSTAQGTYVYNTFSNPTVYEPGQKVVIVYSRWFANTDTLEKVHERTTIDFYIFTISILLSLCCVIYSAWNLKKLIRFTAEERFY